MPREEGGDCRVLRRGERRDGGAHGASTLGALQRHRGGGAPLPARLVRLAAAELAPQVARCARELQRGGAAGGRRLVTGAAGVAGVEPRACQGDTNMSRDHSGFPLY